MGHSFSITTQRVFPLYLELLKQRGIGQETICRHLGIAEFSRGRLGEARQVLERATMVSGAMIHVTMAASRTGRVPVWRSLPRGFVINRKYRVESEVGRGGMASVYRVRPEMDFDERSAYAFKVPAPDLVSTPEALKRFKQEILVSRKLSQEHHPHILPTHGYELFDDRHSGRETIGLVLEFIEGLTLSQFLQRRQAAQKRLEPGEIRAFLKPVCEALAFAHTQGILHRDVKPHNVMLGRPKEKGQWWDVRLMDFGIARVLEDCRDTITKPGMALGTTTYMPPEGYENKWEVRSDVYLAGNLLLELMTFSPKGDVEERSDCPAEWVDLVSEAMNTVRGRRPATMREFLDRLMGQKQPPPPPRNPKEEAEHQAASLAKQKRFGEAVAVLTALPRAHQSLSLLDDLREQWRKQAHEEASRHEKTFDWTSAAEVLEKLPAHLRQAGVLEGYQSNRDTVERLHQEIHDDWQANRKDFLRLKVGEYLKLKPNDDDMARLYQKLPEIQLRLTNSIGVPMVLVPAGSFWMGGSQQVTIAKHFYASIYPVTQGQWQALMGKNPSYFSRHGGGKDNVKQISDADLAQFPVETVSWDEVQKFLKKLNAKEKSSGWVYRLPTEAEWEYICRGSATSFSEPQKLTQQECSYQFYFNQPTNTLTPQLANFRDSGLGRTSKVGSYKANRLGIYDMHGNVWEWCDDLYDGGPPRVIRGGSWINDAGDCTAADRGRGAPDSRGRSLGFRLARVPS
jgi:formylglycine-generating enzyme required for sulfatase activity